MKRSLNKLIVDGALIGAGCATLAIGATALGILAFDPPGTLQATLSGFSALKVIIPCQLIGAAWGATMSFSLARSR
jgi:hypothetical protein